MQTMICMFITNDYIMHLCTWRRRKFNACVSEGYTIRGVAHTTGVAKSTIGDIKKRWQQNSDGYASPKKRRGPLRKTYCQNDRLIVRQCLINRFFSCLLYTSPSPRD